METSGKRVIGSLILLLGLTFFVVGLYTGQIPLVADFVKRVFEPAIAGIS